MHTKEKLYPSKIKEEEINEMNTLMTKKDDVWYCNSCEKRLS